MKLSKYIITSIIFVISFALTGYSWEDDPDRGSECPYIEKQLQNNSGSVCPYLKGQSGAESEGKAEQNDDGISREPEVKNSCPYMENMERIIKSRAVESYRSLGIIST